MMEKNIKPDWDSYFLEILDVIAKRATCNRGKSACILVRDNRILSTGYVGAPSGFEDCNEVGHLLREVKYENGEVRQHCVRTIHAEQNAIVYAARFGVSIDNAIAYCTMQPCYSCAMLLVASGIKKVVAKYPYQVSDSKHIFAKANVELLIINKNALSY